MLEKMTSFTISRWVLVCTFTWFALCVLGCASKPKDFKRAKAVDDVMDSWVGHHQTELIDLWGPPTKIRPDGKGGRILVYESLKGTWGDEKDKRLVGGAQYRTEPKQQGYAAARVFYVNEKGIIESWKWWGL